MPTDPRPTGDRARPDASPGGATVPRRGLVGWLILIVVWIVGLVAWAAWLAGLGYVVVRVFQ